MRVNLPINCLVRLPSNLIGSFDELEKAIAYLDKEDKEMIFLGDTNCDLTQVPYGRSLQSNARHMINIFELNSFRQLVEKPTRVTLDSATIIDHVATPNDENIIKTGGHETSISDQYMVNCIRKFNGVFNTDHKRVRTSSM